jgi:tetratricopeptide (TPR) repeat protein
MSCIKEQDIPQDLLPRAPEFDKTEALGTLKAFGFIKERLSGASYDMHRLVHIAMQNWLKLKDEWRSWNERTLKHVTKVFPWPQHENRAVWKIYLPHAECVVTALKSSFGETLDLPWSLLDKLGESFRIIGKYAEAETMLRQTLQLNEAVFGKDHPATLHSVNNLALSLSRLSKLTEAEAMHRQTLQFRETVLGKDHPDTLMNMRNLALSFFQQGKYAEAEAMYQQTLQLQETALGKNHSSTLMSMIGLAASFSQQGKYAEAEAMLRQTLQLSETVFGKDHLCTFMIMGYLTGSFIEQGKYVEAEGMLQRAYQRTRRSGSGTHGQERFWRRYNARRA